MNLPGLARLLALLAVSLALGACKSSAPYTLPAAAVNSALAVGVSTLQRTQGGCFAQCVGGTVCNPATGFCEKAGVVCIGAEATSMECIGKGGTPTSIGADGPTLAPPTPFPVGISPATGSVPPPPGSRP